MGYACTSRHTADSDSDDADDTADEDTDDDAYPYGTSGANGTSGLLCSSRCFPYFWPRCSDKDREMLEREFELEPLSAPLPLPPSE